MAEIPIPDGVVASEFAAVAVSLDYDANGPRLRLEDLHNDRVVYLDALELETVIWLPDDVMKSLHDPSAHRWTETKPVRVEPPQLSLTGQPDR